MRGGGSWYGWDAGTEGLAGRSGCRCDVESIAGDIFLKEPAGKADIVGDLIVSKVIRSLHLEPTERHQNPRLGSCDSETEPLRKEK